MLDEFYNAEKSIGKNIETELRKIITDNFLVLNQETDDTEH